MAISIPLEKKFTELSGLFVKNKKIKKEHSGLVIEIFPKTSQEVHTINK